MKDFLGVNESEGFVESIPPKVVLQERISSDLALEIGKFLRSLYEEKFSNATSINLASNSDYTTCKKYGASYRALPKSYVLPVCSGRTELCNRVQ